MTRNIHSARPARAAIAAGLAFTATPLLAQELSVPPAATTTVPTAALAPETAAPAPMAPPSATAAIAPPVMAPANPVVQPTASVEARIAEAVAKSEAERPVRSEQRAATSSAPAKTQSRRAVPVAPAPVERVEAAPPIAPPAPVAANVAPAVPVAATPEPAPAPVASADNGQDALTLGLGGAALLVAGLAGTAVVMRRRRHASTPAYEESIAPIDAVAVPVAAPVAQAEPIAPIAPAPALADAKTHGAPATTLEAMIAQEPSPENPFLTHAKRKRRAMALLSQQTQADAPIVAASVQPASVPTAAPADRSQTVHSFAKGGLDTGSALPTFLKPRTS